MQKKKPTQPTPEKPVPRTMEQIVFDEIDDIWLVALQFVQQHGWEPSMAVNGVIQARVELLKAAGLLLADGGEPEPDLDIEPMRVDIVDYGD